MKISWKWLNEWVDLSGVAPEALAETLTRRGLEVEGIARQDRGFEKVVTAKLLTRDKHPQADRLSLCQVDPGTGQPLSIVCGARNMKAGDTVALALAGALLPNGAKIEVGKIRGEVSNGMLCSEEELKLLQPGEVSEGILILPPSTPPGQPLAKVLGLDDTILTFKLTANRGDCLSHYGMAREVGAALRLPVKAVPGAELPEGGCPVAVELEAGPSGAEGGGEAPQFYGAWIEGVKVGPSPAEVVRKLESIGARSINNVVDATNLALWELGHPVHAYDGDLIRGQGSQKKIGVRHSRPGERLPLLDGSTVTLDGSELVIADGQGAVGLAGVMGGGNSEVRPGTTRVFLEVAEFNPALVRKASTRHQKKTEAAYRFERGVDPDGLQRVLKRLAQLVTQLAGGEVVGSAKAGAGGAHPRIRLDKGYVARFLGLEVSGEEVTEILASLDCEVEGSPQGALTVTPPSYRLDLRRPEDLAEEVARTLGYDAIPETLPAVVGEARFGKSVRGALALVDRAKDSLVAQGFWEAVTFAFTSRSWLEKLKTSPSVKLVNPLSEDLECLVPSLLPGMLQSVLTNGHHHFGSEPLAVRLFELRPTFSAKGVVAAQGEGETGVEERWKLALAMSGPRYASGLRSERGEVDFYDLKGVLEAALESVGTRGHRLMPVKAGVEGPPLFHPGQSVEVLVGSRSAGFAGRLHPQVERALKLRVPLWIAELDWEVLISTARGASECRRFKAWPPFPGMERDYALVVKEDVTADRIVQVAMKAGKPLAKSAKVFDIYRGSQLALGMTSIAVRVIFYEETRSLQESEVEATSAKILESWKKELQAELRG